MNAEVKEFIVNGRVYIPKETYQPATKRNNMKYVIVRTYTAGVFAGFLESRSGQEIIMRDARRIWSWKGAASLSQLAMEGTACPEACKFPIACDKIELLQAIEILDCTEKAKQSIESVPIWKV